jgi:hypothetical protein
MEGASFGVFINEWGVSALGTSDGKWYVLSLSKYGGVKIIKQFIWHEYE